MTVGELRQLLYGWDNDAKVYLQLGVRPDRNVKLARTEFKVSKRNPNRMDLVLIGKDKDGHVHV